MGISEILIVFFISSWLVFFAVVGIGTESQDEAGEVTAGTDPGAPTNPQIMKKFIWSGIGGLLITILFGSASMLGVFERISELVVGSAL